MCSTLIVCTSSNKDRQTRYLKNKAVDLQGFLRGFQGGPWQNER